MSDWQARALRAEDQLGSARRELERIRYLFMAKIEELGLELGPGPGDKSYYELVLLWEEIEEKQISFDFEA